MLLMRDSNLGKTLEDVGYGNCPRPDMEKNGGKIPKRRMEQQGFPQVGPAFHSVPAPYDRNAGQSLLIPFERSRLQHFLAGRSDIYIYIYIACLCMHVAFGDIGK